MGDSSLLLLQELSQVGGGVVLFLLLHPHRLFGYHLAVYVAVYVAIHVAVKIGAEVGFLLLLAEEK